MINVERRSETAKMAHLLVELHRRLKAVGRNTEGVFESIPQSVLSDCLGLSAVHVNRVLQELRANGLLTVNRCHFHLLKRAKLEQLAGFDGASIQRSRLRPG